MAGGWLGLGLKIDSRTRLMTRSQPAQPAQRLRNFKHKLHKNNFLSKILLNLKFALNPPRQGPASLASHNTGKFDTDRHCLHSEQIFDRICLGFVWMNTNFTVRDKQTFHENTDCDLQYCKQNVTIRIAPYKSQRRPNNWSDPQWL